VRIMSADVLRAVVRVRTTARLRRLFASTFQTPIGLGALASACRIMTTLAEEILMDRLIWGVQNGTHTSIAGSIALRVQSRKANAHNKSRLLAATSAAFRENVQLKEQKCFNFYF